MGEYKRSFLPEAILLNGVAEKAPTQQEQQYALRARSGLAAFKMVGTGRARALYAKPGLFDDRALVISDTAAYLLDKSAAVTTLTGTLAGSGFVDVAMGQDADLNSLARVATGSALYKVTEAGGVMQEDFPSSSGAGATSICEHRGFWFATVDGADQAYYLLPGDTVWNAFSFASAEYSPDPLKGIRSRGDQFVLLGSATTEVWTLTGQASPPIEPYGGLNFDFGCRAIRSAVNCAGTLIWVDDHNIVRSFSGGDVTIISDNGLVEQIAGQAADDLSASFVQDGIHAFYVLRLGSTATWAYDLSTNQWSRRSSLGSDFWRANLFAAIDETTLASDIFTNQIYTASASALDDAGSVFPMEFTAFLELSEGSVPCANIELICETGDAPLSGQGSNPLIQMRYSDDLGRTWSGWRERSMGLTGQYSTRVRWNALGTIKAPYGRIFHFRVSDPIGRRFSDLRMNVP